MPPKPPSKPAPGKATPKDKAAAAPTTVTAAQAAQSAQSHKRSPMEQDFERLRALDRLEDGVDAIGPKGLQQLCQELGIGFTELDMFIFAWRMGATQSMCITRSEWMHSAFQHKLEHLGQMRVALGSWRNMLRDDENAYADMYYQTYDFVRGDTEKMLPMEKAVRVWNAVLPEARFPLLHSWVQWLQSEFKRPISRDIWRQIYEVARRVKDAASYDPNDKWPTAIDDFMEWHKSGAGITAEKKTAL